VDSLVDGRNALPVLIDCDIEALVQGYGGMSISGLMRHHLDRVYILGIERTVFPTSLGEKMPKGMLLICVAVAQVIAANALAQSRPAKNNPMSWKDILDMAGRQSYPTVAPGQPQWPSPDQGNVIGPIPAPVQRTFPPKE
jgi:hypothetical protein